MKARIAVAAILAVLAACPAAAQKAQHPSVAPTIPVACTSYDYSFSSPSAAAVTVLNANAARESITFSVPSTLTGGLWLEWSYNSSTLAQITASTSSINFPAGTSLVTLDVSVVGTGPITAYTTTGSVSVPFKECQ